MHSRQNYKQKQFENGQNEASHEKFMDSVVKWVFRLKLLHRECSLSHIKKNDSVENGKRQHSTRVDEQKSMEFQTWNKVM